MPAVTKPLYLNSSGAAVIANGESVSAEIGVRGYDSLFLRMPAAWTTANIALHTSEESAGTFTLLKDKFGNAVTIAVGTDDSFSAIGVLSGVRVCKLISVDQSDATSAVAQGAARTIQYSLE